MYEELIDNFDMEIKIGRQSRGLLLLDLTDKYKQLLNKHPKHVKDKITKGLTKLFKDDFEEMIRNNQYEILDPINLIDLNRNIKIMIKNKRPEIRKVVYRAFIDNYNFHRIK